MGKKSKGKKNKKSGKSRNRNNVRANNNNNEENRNHTHDDRRFTTNTDADGDEDSDEGADLSIDDVKMVAFKYVTNDLIEAVLARGVIEDERHLNEPDNLTEYFFVLVQDMARCPCASYLYNIIVAILVGLAKGPPHVNRRIGAGGSEPMPILTWACQWKQLQKITHNCFPAGDELVDMILRAGAEVNDIISNKTNALFFAVKYADMIAINSLIRAGINLQQRNVFNQSCLYNAIEYPRRVVVERLLSEGMDGNEMFPRSSEIIHSIPDMILSNMKEDTIISWDILGPPSAADIGETLILLRQKGANFTAESCEFLNLIGQLHNDTLIIDDTQKRGNEIFTEVAMYLVGTKIPSHFLPESVDSILNDEENKPTLECPTCLSAIVKKKSVTLYCGHTFCIDCILSQDNIGCNGNERNCPLCRRALCLDASLQNVDDLIEHCTTERPIHQVEQLYGRPQEEALSRGPQFLCKDQIIAEAEFQGIHNQKKQDSISSLREKIITERQKGENLSILKECAYGYNEHNIMLDMATNIDISRGNGLGSNDIITPPKDGVSCIDVHVNGVPLLARVSTLTPYTMVSVLVAKELHLTKVEHLKTNKFVRFINGASCDNMNFTCLEPFTVRIGNRIDVKLTNAVVISPDLSGMFGIQLGCDFLSSALWCPIDVEVEGGYMRSLDGFEVAYSLDQPSRSMLRYYSREGRTAYSPILPFGPFNGSINSSFGLGANVNMDECFYCKRVFPDGMLCCKTCNDLAGIRTTYCNQHCQFAGWHLHKRFHSKLCK